MQETQDINSKELERIVHKAITHGYHKDIFDVKEIEKCRYMQKAAESWLSILNLIFTVAIFLMAFFGSFILTFGKDANIPYYILFVVFIIGALLFIVALPVYGRCHKFILDAEETIQSENRIKRKAEDLKIAKIDTEEKEREDSNIGKKYPGLETLVVKLGLDRISKINLFSYSRLIYLALSSFLIIFAILLTIIFFNGDYETILRIAEFVIIGSGTLAILIFTYAIAKKGEKIEEQIVHSGEFIFKSTITFIISLGLLPGIGFILKNHTSYSSSLGILKTGYDFLLVLTTMIIFLIGIVGLFSSVYFLSVGLKELMEVFETNVSTYPDKITNMN